MSLKSVMEHRVLQKEFVRSMKFVGNVKDSFDFSLAVYLPGKATGKYIGEFSFDCGTIVESNRR